MQAPFKGPREIPGRAGQGLVPGGAQQTCHMNIAVSSWISSRARLASGPGNPKGGASGHQRGGTLWAETRTCLDSVASSLSLGNGVLVQGLRGTGLLVVLTTGRGIKPAKQSFGFASSFGKEIAPTSQHQKEPLSLFTECLTSSPNRGPERSSQASAVTQPGACLTPEPVL